MFCMLCNDNTSLMKKERREWVYFAYFHSITSCKIIFWGNSRRNKNILYKHYKLLRCILHLKQEMHLHYNTLYIPGLNQWKIYRVKQITLYAINSTICYIYRNFMAHFTLKCSQMNCTFTLGFRAHSTSYGYPNIQAYGILEFSYVLFLKCR